MNELVVFQESFNIHLRRFLDAKTRTVASHTQNPSIAYYMNHAKEIILGPGKRVRPYIAYLMYKSLGGQDDEEVLKLLVGLEIFHSFAFVHDDIMDSGKLRHKEETSHVYIAKKLRREKRKGKLKHASQSQAILIGDILFSWSQEIIDSNSDFDPEKMAKVKNLFHEMAEEVALGQMVDIDFKTRDIVSEEDIYEKIRLKTSGYTFIKPLQIGAALAGNETEEIEVFCQEFGPRMGIAFQIQDDLLDIISNDNKLGKTSSSDKSENQHTFFTYLAPEAVKGIMAKNFRESRELVRKLSIDEGAKQKFLDLIRLMQERES